MTGMIEKVAKAIAKNPPSERFEDRDGETVLIIDLERTARAAIEAMMEPTEEMRTAMRLANMNVAGSYGGPSGWEAAIQEALKEAP